LKYSYQYHWALFRNLNDHTKANKYAVFVVSDSLDASKAKFEFNQVKTIKGHFTAHKLVHQMGIDDNDLGEILKRQKQGFRNTY